MTETTESFPAGQQEIPLTTGQLQALLSAIQLVNSTLNLDEMLNIIVREVNRNLDADRSTLFLVDVEKGEIWSKVLLGDASLEIRQPIGRGLAGYVARTGEVVNVADAYQDPRFNPEVDRRSGYRTRSVLCVPVRDRDGHIIGVVESMNKKEGPFREGDVQFLRAFADHIAVAIQNAQLYHEALERKRLEEELQVAAEIQKHLLPEQWPRLRQYEIFAFQKPSKFVGGDYYDFFPQHENLGLVLVDVSGKGIPAALLMANLQAAFHALVGSRMSAPRMLRKINQHLFDFTAQDKFATVVWVQLDTRKHRLTYINAGHVPPLLLHYRNGDPLIRQLKTGGLPLGFLHPLTYREGQARMQPGDVLVICSDGITEAQCADGSMFGLDGLIRLLKSNGELSARALGEKILDAVAQFCGTAANQDDVTLLIVKRVI
ncbi:MAG: SpoIIE family protein phosphatase [Calditrichaeota bacterium]|nr:SpoIIE family protein phosphatase [Calditrichota bacterium]